MAALVRTDRAQNWFWGNALNPLDTRTVVKDFGGWREFSGKKSFCSGASDSEMLIASAVDESAGGKLLIAAIPSGRSGITLHNDWNNIGQRQTDSGSATFERVRVEESELLLDPGPLSTPFACLRPLIAQLTFTHMFLGIAEGAFDEARNYTLTETRPWHKSAPATCAKTLTCSPLRRVLGGPGRRAPAGRARRRCSTRPGPKART
jgi:alkylation response protein AidB-like acyl-CoA dehydrogenase